ncbi:MAG: hypothetical protein R2692_05865 [Microbacterium sp.]
MDPVWAAIAEFWWIGPTMIGAGTLGWIGLRGQRSAKARRLAYDASRDALRTARQDAAASRIAVRVARAELAQAQAEAAAGRTTHAEVAAARRALDAAQRETRAAAAGVRARRASLSADRVALSAQGSRGSDPAQLPLGRVMAADDAVTARWMQYETDPARQLAFPAMGDARVPSTAAFLAELKTTRALRPRRRMRGSPPRSSPPTATASPAWPAPSTPPRPRPGGWRGERARRRPAPAPTHGARRVGRVGPGNRTEPHPDGPRPRCRSARPRDRATVGRAAAGGCHGPPHSADDRHPHRLSPGAPRDPDRAAHAARLDRPPRPGPRCRGTGLAAGDAVGRRRGIRCPGEAAGLADPGARNAPVTPVRARARKV